MSEYNEKQFSSVLVISPHPYDADLWASGTIAKLIATGSSVHYAICSDGSKTSADPYQGENLKSVRMQEQQMSANYLSIESITFFELIDGELEDDDTFRKLIVKEIRRQKPDLVITSEPYRKRLSWHRDHRITGQVALDSVYPYARDHLHYQDLWENEQLEPHNTGAIWFWGSEHPDIYIDIESTFPLKIKSVSEHKSQLNTTDYDVLERQLKTRSEQVKPGSIYLEAFREVTFRV